MRRHSEGVYYKQASSSSHSTHMEGTSYGDVVAAAADVDAVVDSGGESTARALISSHDDLNAW